MTNLEHVMSLLVRCESGVSSSQELLDMERARTYALASIAESLDHIVVAINTTRDGAGRLRLWVQPV